MVGGTGSLIGVMVPPMRLRDVTFARRTVAIQTLLRNDWWGQRDSTLPRDPDEEAYAACYPGVPPAPNVPAPDQGVAGPIRKGTLAGVFDVSIQICVIGLDRQSVNP